jgi:hypothetical protein
MRRVLLLLAVTTACSDPVTATVVTVEARPSVREVETLEVTFANENATLTQTFTVGGRDFPLTFSVETPERTGEVTMTARGLDEDGGLVALGVASSMITPDQIVDATMLLDPADFTINTGFAGSQKLAWSNAQAGTQIAAGPDGTFTVGFTDDCGGLGRCDLFARRFDVAATPVRIEANASDAQFIVNVTEVFGNDPALAVAPDGTMLAAWSTLSDVLAIALTPEGSAKSLVETTVSTGTSADDVAVAAYPDGRFILVWTETDLTTSERTVRARLLDADGAPLTNPENNATDPFTLDGPQDDAPDAPAVAATGNGLEAAFLWRNGQTIHLRLMDSTGKLLGPQPVELVAYDALDDLWSPRIAALASARYVVAWGHRTFGGGLFDDGVIVARKIAAPTGEQLGVDAFIGRGLADSFTRFGLAEGDGQLVATWHACGPDVDGSDCGVLARVFRDTGLPVGEPIPVNTTTLASQTTPSVTWLGAASADHGQAAFAFAWTDESGATPDDSETQIRGRVLYPVYDDAAGILGAECGGTGATPCGAGLVCLAGTDSVARCHRSCDPAGPDPDCPEGGICTTAGEISGCKL